MIVNAVAADFRPSHRLDAPVFRLEVALEGDLAAPTSVPFRNSLRRWRTQHRSLLGLKPFRFQFRIDTNGRVPDREPRIPELVDHSK